VGDEHEGCAGRGVQFKEQVDDGTARFIVEVAGRFVGKEDFRPVDEGTGQGHPLLLAAGELVGVVVEALAQADAFEAFGGGRSGAADPAQFEWHEDVFPCGERGEELETLENKSRGGIAQGGERVLVEVVEVVSVEQDGACIRPVETGAESEQSCFAAAGRPDNGAVGTGGQIEPDVGQHGQRMPATEVVLPQSVDRENGAFGCFVFGCRPVRGFLVSHMRWKVYVVLCCLVTALRVSAAEEPRRVVVLGDSITAGYNLEPQEAYPALLQEKIKAEGWDYEVINAGLSGDTTAGGRRRIEWVLAGRAPEVVMIALGGNDGLRGLPVGQVAENLGAIIDQIRAANPRVKILLAGMQMPDSMGRDYADSFARVFAEVAAEYDTALLPFLLEGVAGEPELNQPDLIHPTAEGQRRIAERVWPALRPWLAP